MFRELKEELPNIKVFSSLACFNKLYFGGGVVSSYFRIKSYLDVRKFGSDALPS